MPLRQPSDSTLAYGSGPYDCTCHVYNGSVGWRRVPDPRCPVHREPIHDTCAVHTGTPEPCPQCESYIAAGL